MDTAQSRASYVDVVAQSACSRRELASTAPALTTISEDAHGSISRVQLLRGRTRPQHDKPDSWLQFQDDAAQLSRSADTRPLAVGRAARRQSITNPPLAA
jgi:hypothetical protein